MESSLLTQESRRSRRCRQRASRGRGLDQDGGRTQSMCYYLYLLQKCSYIYSQYTLLRTGATFSLCTSTVLLRNEKGSSPLTGSRTASRSPLTRTLPTGTLTASKCQGTTLRWCQKSVRSGGVRGRIVRTKCKTE